MMTARSDHRGKVAAPALLATASLLALLAGMPVAVSDDCAAQAAPPADLATPSMVYEALSARTNAQLLAMAFLHKPVEQSCAWIYEVRLMTASGSVVELDFNADGLALIGARGPQNDRDAAALVKTLGGDASVLTTARQDSRGKDAGPDDGDGHGGGGHGGGDDGGEGGNSGSGSDNSGHGEGGNSGSGGGGNSGPGGGGEGGEGGGGEGGEGGGGEGGEGGH
jgi:hypothetical protein